MFNVGKITKMPKNKLSVPVEVGTSGVGKYIILIFYTENINELFVKLSTDWLSWACLLIKCINNSQWQSSWKHKYCIFIKCLASGSECEQTHWNSIVKSNVLFCTSLSRSKDSSHVSKLKLYAYSLNFSEIYITQFLFWKLVLIFLTQLGRRAEGNRGS